MARVALYENSSWVPVVLLLGLVSCAMPPALKAELILTLAAFAKTPGELLQDSPSQNPVKYLQLYPDACNGCILQTVNFIQL